MGNLKTCARAASLLAFVWTTTAPARAATVTVTIDRVTELECFDEAGAICASSADFYAQVDIGSEHFTTDVIEDDDDIFPDWTFEVPIGLFPVDVQIEIFDSDQFPPDNEADLVPGAGLALDLTIDNLCDITGDQTGACGEVLVSSGTAPDHAEITYHIDVTPLVDSDEDNLPDRWEVYGIDADGDGVVDYDLPAVGVDPLHKDILVEADYMTEHLPDAEALDRSAHMFVDAPLDNPDGRTGAVLHVLVDEEIPHLDKVAFPCDDDAVTVDFVDLKAQFFGTAAERASPTTLEAKALAFRYVLFAHDSTDFEPVGIGELGGNDFAVVLGSSFFRNDNDHPVGSMKEQAEVFSHELGHTLGFPHGGTDEINCKPNYVSIMSYSYNGWIESPGFPLGRLDYSSETLATLLEDDLDESLGVGDGLDEISWVDLFGTWQSAPGDGPLDWDGDGAIDVDPVAVDLNDRGGAGCSASPGETLFGFDDWNLIQFSFAQDTPDCVPPESQIIEQTYDEFVALRSCPDERTCDHESLAFWQAQCGSDLGTEAANLDTYAACVSDIATFSTLTTGDEVCAELLAERESCDQAEAAFLALLLNRCSGRVPTCCTVPDPFDSPRIPDAFVDDTIQRADRVLSDAAPTAAECTVVLDELEDVANGTCGPADLFGVWGNGAVAVGNVETGLPTKLASTGLDGPTSIVWDPDASELLVATGDGSDELWRVPVTDDLAGDPELVGPLVYVVDGLELPLTDLQALDLAPEISATLGFVPGQLYGVDLGGTPECPAPCALVLDKATAIATPVRSLDQTVAITGLSFHPTTGELWAWDDGLAQLFTLDAELLETPGLQVGTCGRPHDALLSASSLAHSCEGRLYAADTTHFVLVEIDLASGCLAPIGPRGSFRKQHADVFTLGLDGGASLR